MASLLEMPLAQVYNDRQLLQRVLRAIQLDQGLEFLPALEEFQAATESAYNSNEPTLAGALKWGKTADPTFVEDALRILEQRDQAVQAAFDRAAGPVLLDQAVDGGGRVLLDQGAATVRPDLQPAAYPSARPAEPLTADIGKVLADPQEQERRLARMRKATRGGYDGPKGREQFLKEDRLHAEGGVDMVATAERQNGLRAARVQADQVGAELDRAIADAGSKRGKLLALDAKIAELEDSAPSGVSFDVARDQVRSRADAAGRKPLKLLDQLAAEPRNPGARPSDQQILDTLKAGGTHDATRLLDQRLQGDLRQLEQVRQTQGDAAYVKALRAYYDSAEVPEATPTAAQADADPKALVQRGLHPGSHQLDQEIRARIRDLGRDPNRDYAVTLAEILAAEDGS